MLHRFRVLSLRTFSTTELRPEQTFRSHLILRAHSRPQAKIDAAANKKPKGHVSVLQAIDLIREFKFGNMDQTIDICVNLSLDPRKPNQSIRTTIGLPFSSGKKVNVAVFSGVEDVTDSEIIKSSVAFVGGEEMVQKFMTKTDGHKIKALTHVYCTPEILPSLQRHLGKKLGPRKILPNVNLGTVVDGVDELRQRLEALKKGTCILKTDPKGAVRVSVGKASYDNNMLEANCRTVLQAIIDHKPAKAKKGRYIDEVTMSGTMSPGFKILRVSADPTHKLFMSKSSDEEVDVARTRAKKVTDDRNKRLENRRINYVSRVKPA